MCGENMWENVCEKRVRKCVEGTSHQSVILHPLIFYNVISKGARISVVTLVSIMERQV